MHISQETISRCDKLHGFNILIGLTLSHSHFQTVLNSAAHGTCSKPNTVIFYTLLHRQGLLQGTKIRTSDQ